MPFVSIPAPSFQPGRHAAPQNFLNESGTAFHFHNTAFAPVFLPDGTLVTELKAGAHVESPTIGAKIVLQRNEPQQANVEMAAVETSSTGNQFQFVSTTSIRERTINNERYSYYIVVDLHRDSQVVDGPTDITVPGRGPEASSISFVRVGYRTDLQRPWRAVRQLLTRDSQ